MRTTTQWTVFVYIALILSGCMTVEGPDSKYVLSKKGFEQAPKANTSNKLDNRNINKKENIPPKKTYEDSPNNKEYAWGVGNRKRGREPDPMSSFIFVYQKDIDTAYIRIKKEFGFLSLDDMNNNPYVRDAVKSKSLLHIRYVAIPNVQYTMRNWIRHPYASEEPSNTIEVDLAKEGQNKVRIQVSYYSGHTIDKAGYETSLKQRILRSLGQ
ncbi:MAG: hypothetical protein AB2761_19010 [Candidatus Thiodiazotropha endolucinida]